jgi:DnaJ-domain-containing protein 1
MPLMQAIDFVCMRMANQIMKRIDGENDQKMYERLESSSSLVVQISLGIQHFLGLYFLSTICSQGVLLNEICVEMKKRLSSLEDSCKQAKDLVKEFHDKKLDKAINEGASFDDAKKDMYEDLNQKVDYDSNMGGDFNQETDDNPNEESSTKSSTDDQQSPYDVLGISEKASIPEIKAAYRNMCLKYHPDRTGGLGEKLRKLAEEEMKKINRAYEKIMKSRGQK